MKIISENNSDAVALAKQFLQDGLLISFASDTVYGIACDASNSKAAERLYDLKNRDPKKPIAIFVKDLETAKKIFIFDELSEKIAQEFFPGALTLVLKTQPNIQIKISPDLNKDNEFLGFRIVDRNFIKNLMANFDGVLAVTSANLAGQNPAASAKEVKKYFSNSKLDLLIDGGISQEKEASTVVKINNQKLEILRQGAISQSLIKFIS